MAAYTFYRAAILTNYIKIINILLAKRLERNLI
jgi:hypothetical protein